ncbi:MAG TPA: hypothetical protein VNI54_12165 [Thermoanaerobaculia bacterium]|nr:hypothetical protein [Thermoanaerobaculia bacterium]
MGEPTEVASEPEIEVGRHDQRTVAAAVERMRAWITGWTVTAVVLPIVMILLGVVIASYLNRPQLFVSIAKGLSGSYRIVQDTGVVYEYRTVVDFRTPCVAWLARYSADSDAILPPARERVLPRIFYGIYLENRGRSELTDIRLTFSSRFGEFEVAGSPQLALSQSRETSPGGYPIRTVTIASLAPQQKGVVLGTLAIAGGSVFIQQQSPERFKVNYELGDADRSPQLNQHVTFSGSRQLSETPFMAASVDDMLAQQKTAFGLDAIHFPIEPLEVSAQGGVMSIKLIRAPFMACPGSAADGSYNVSFRQRGVDDNGASQNPL